MRGKYKMLYPVRPRHHLRLLHTIREVLENRVEEEGMG